jgi:hypothetical protein
MSAHDSLKEQRDYVWAYFQLHANQRMMSFNFFIILAALLTTGLAGTLKSDFQYHWMSILLALSLIIISFIFQKLDQRVRFLIRHPEDALKVIEEQRMSSEHGIGAEVALFRMEEQKTDELRGLSFWKARGWNPSYAMCFQVVYAVFGLLGIVGTIGAVRKWIEVTQGWS